MKNKGGRPTGSGYAIEPPSAEAIIAISNFKKLYERTKHFEFEMTVQQHLSGKENWRKRRDIIHYITGEFIQSQANCSMKKTLDVLRASFKQYQLF